MFERTNECLGVWGLPSLALSVARKLLHNLANVKNGSALVINGSGSCGAFLISSHTSFPPTRTTFSSPRFLSLAADERWYQGVPAVLLVCVKTSNLWGGPSGARSEPSCQPQGLLEHLGWGGNSPNNWPLLLPTLPLSPLGRGHNLSEQSREPG